MWVRDAGAEGETGCECTRACVCVCMCVFECMCPLVFGKLYQQFDDRCQSLSYLKEFSGAQNVALISSSTYHQGLCMLILEYKINNIDNKFTILAISAQ